MAQSLNGQNSNMFPWQLAQMAGLVNGGQQAQQYPGFQMPQFGNQMPADPYGLQTSVNPYIELMNYLNQSTQQPMPTSQVQQPINENMDIMDKVLASQQAYQRQMEFDKEKAYNDSLERRSAEAERQNLSNNFGGYNVDRDTMKKYGFSDEEIDNLISSPTSQGGMDYFVEQGWITPKGGSSQAPIQETVVASQNIPQEQPQNMALQAFQQEYVNSLAGQELANAGQAIMSGLAPAQGNYPGQITLEEWQQASKNAGQHKYSGSRFANR